jgi:glucose-6-phosphate-specific signal transduction histidine kinase
VRALNKDPLAWGRYVAVAGAYAASYEITRYFSFSHWMLPAGLRVACLLLVPRRFWPALAIGEALPVAEMAALHARAFGGLWAVLVSVPIIGLCTPAIVWLRRHAALYREDGQINMNLIMLATFACSLIGGAVNTYTLTLMQMGDGSPAPVVEVQDFMLYFLGQYLGALTLTPTILAMRERLAALPGGSITWPAIRHSVLARDMLLIVVPWLALTMALASQVEGTALQCVRMAMALPVFALTLRTGWHGSAVSGMLASIALASTSFTLTDPLMIQAQVVIALAVTTSLIFGVRVARRMAANHSLALQQACHDNARHRT